MQDVPVATRPALASKKSKKLNIFISYSRQDIAFVDRLQTALGAHDIQAFVDREHIEKSEEWWARIKQLITEADTVIFVLSPGSISSAICNDEVSFAEKLNKRFVPIVARDFEGHTPPVALSRFNYIFFIPNTASDASGDFDEAIDNLIRALETDISWIREHTRLGSLAERWEARKRPGYLLLRAAELSAAETWLTTRPEKAPDPTDTHRAFLTNSRRASTRRQRWWLGGVSMVSIAAFALAAYAYTKRLDAERQTDAAIAAKNVAEINQSASLAALAETRLADDPLSAIKLALASWPRDSSTDIGKKRFTLDLLRRALPVQYLRGYLAGHTDNVTDVEVSPDQTAALTSSEDGTARLWLLASGTTERVFEPGKGPVFRAQFSPDGRRIITIAKHGAQVWDRNTGSVIFSLDHDQWAVLKPGYYSHDGTKLLTVQANTAYLWDASTGKRIATLSHPDPITAAQFSLDDSRIVTADGSLDLYRPAKIGIWDGKTGAQLKLFDAHNFKIFGLAFSPDGKRFATSSGGFGSEADNTAKVWDLATGTKQFELVGHSATVHDVAFSPNGALIATASFDRTARLWSAKTGNEVHVLKGHKASVGSVKFSSGGSRLFTTSTSQDGSLRLWDVVSGREIAVFDGHGGGVTKALITSQGDKMLTIEHDSAARIWDTRSLLAQGLFLFGDVATSISWAPSGKNLLVSSDTGEVSILDMEKHRYVLQEVPDQYKMTWASFAAQCNCIWTANANGVVKLWDISGSKLREVRTFSTKSSVASAPPQLSSDGKRIAISEDDGVGVVVIKDVETGATQISLTGSASLITNFAFSPDGRHIAAAHEDGSAEVWNAETGASVAVFIGHRAEILAIRFSPDGTKLLTASWDHTARLWDIASRRPLHVLRGHFDLLFDIDFSADGTRILTASKDKTARLWATNTGRELAVLAGHSGSLKQARFSPTGRFIATASADGTARLWDADTATTIAVFHGHSKGVSTVLFDKNESKLITAAEDNEVRMWDLTTIPKGNLFNIICGRIPDRELGSTATRLGLASVLPICTNTEPLPDAVMLLDPIGPPTGASGRVLANAWLLLFDNRYDDALAYARQAGSTMMVGRGRQLQALALMLSDQTPRAKALFEAGRGTFIYPDNIPKATFDVWEDVTLADFAELRAAGLSNKLMDDVEDEYRQRVAIKAKHQAMLDAANGLLKAKQYEKALNHLRDIDQFVQEQSGREPWNQNWKLLMAQSKSNIAATLRLLEKTSAAEEGYRESIALAEASATEFAEPIFYRQLQHQLISLSDFAPNTRPLLEQAMEIFRKLHNKEATGVEDFLLIGPDLLRRLQQLDNGDIKRAVDAKNWTEAVSIQKRSLARSQFASTMGIGTAGEAIKQGFGVLAWHYLFAREFNPALTAAQRAIDLDDNPNDPLHFDIIAMSNKAHALMFLDRIDEATRVYDLGRGYFVKDESGNKTASWEQAIVEDFATLRAAGLDHPLMSSIEAKLMPKQ